MSSEPSFTATYHQRPYPALDPSHAAGKVVVITGGGSGIGKATAKAFARASAKHIILIGRTQKKLQETKDELEQALEGTNSKDTRIWIYQADITDVDAVSSVFSRIKESLGTVDVLINNAGYLSDIKPLSTCDLSEWWQGFESNVKGSALVFRAFLSVAREGSTVVNVSSKIAHIPAISGLSAYSSSKMAAARLVEHLQKENDTLRCFNLHPGVIATEMGDKGGSPPEDSVDLPASVCLWLISPQADFLRGRFIWSNWDVNELVAKKEEILGRDLLTTGLRGWNQ